MLLTHETRCSTLLVNSTVAVDPQQSVATSTWEKFLQALLRVCAIQTV